MRAPLSRERPCHPGAVAMVRPGRRLCLRNPTVPRGRARPRPNSYGRLGVPVFNLIPKKSFGALKRKREKKNVETCGCEVSPS